MSIFYEKAYGNFDPQNDQNFVVKFVLDLVVVRKDFDKLYELLNGKGNFDIWENEAGWEIERRKKGGEDSVNYNNWPKNADFRIYLDPQEYASNYPELFLSRKTFCTYISRLLLVYLSIREFEATTVIEKILLLVSNKHGNEEEK